MDCKINRSYRVKDKYNTCRILLIAALLIKIFDFTIVHASSGVIVAAAEKQNAERIQWYLQTTLDAYNRVGMKDPRWDNQAQQALILMATHWNKSPDRRGDELFQVFNLGREALAAGCRDPLVQYITAWAADALERMSFMDIRKMYLASAKGMEESGYSTHRKCWAYLRAADFLVRLHKATSQDRFLAREYLDAIVSSYPELVKDENISYEHWQAMDSKIISTFKYLGDDSLKVYKKTALALMNAGASPSLVNTLKGAFYINYAWEVRGHNFKVSEERRKLTAKRLVLAIKALTIAWKADSDNPVAAQLMINTLLHLSDNRKKMEICFKRAVKADRDMYSAYSSKLNWLEPKWHGSIEAMLSFGRECLEAQNWHAQIPFILVRAHLAASRYGKTKYHPFPRLEYFKDKKVWEELQKVYNGYLQRYPKDFKRHGEYALYACWAEDWATAHREFQIVGDRVVNSTFSGPVLYSGKPRRGLANFFELRQEAAHKLKTIESLDEYTLIPFTDESDLHDKPLK